MMILFLEFNTVWTVYLQILKIYTPPKLLITKGKDWIKPGRHYLNQVTRVNITSNKTCRHLVPLL